MKGLFITGTDTDVGKTVVTAGLLKLLRLKGIDAIPMKPVQTGCIESSSIDKNFYQNETEVAVSRTADGRRRALQARSLPSFAWSHPYLTDHGLRATELIAPDLEFALSYSGMNYTEEEMKYMSPYKYIPACSPHLAGSLAGNYPYIKDIMVSLNKLAKNRELVLVEGAGGTMVPLNDNEMMIDLIKETKFPVIIVSHTGLGTINHTLLTINQLRACGIDVLGVVFNNTKPPEEGSKFIYDDNIKTIQKFGNVNILGIIDYIVDINESSNICFEKNIDFEIIKKYF